MSNRWLFASLCLVTLVGGGHSGRGESGSVGGTDAEATAYHNGTKAAGRASTHASYDKPLFETLLRNAMAYPPFFLFAVLIRYIWPNTFCSVRNQLPSRVNAVMKALHEGKDKYSKVRSGTSQTCSPICPTADADGDTDDDLVNGGDDDSKDSGIANRSITTTKGRRNSSSGGSIGAAAEIIDPRDRSYWVYYIYGAILTNFLSFACGYTWVLSLSSISVSVNTAVYNTHQ
jgi:hypothetical protein